MSAVAAITNMKTNKLGEEMRVLGIVLIAGGVFFGAIALAFINH